VYDIRDGVAGYGVLGEIELPPLYIGDGCVTEARGGDGSREVPDRGGGGGG
jgi:hypothetical protein